MEERKRKERRKKKEERKERRGKQKRCGKKNIRVWERRKKEERKENGFNSRCSNGRKLIGRELKLVYSPRATSRCKKKKKNEVEFFPTLVPYNLRTVNGCVV